MRDFLRRGSTVVRLLIEWLCTRIRCPFHLLPDDTIRVTHNHVVERATDTVLKSHPQRYLPIVKNHVKERLGSNKILVPNPGGSC